MDQISLFQRGWPLPTLALITEMRTTSQIFYYISDDKITAVSNLRGHLMEMFHLLDKGSEVWR